MIPGSGKTVPGAALQSALIDTTDLQNRLAVILAAKYKSIQLLAVGGMASIWLARHKMHRGLFTIKVLHPQFSHESELRQSFHREAMNNAALAQHPNVVPVLDMDHSDGLYYLIMPYIEGWDLDQALKKLGHLETADALTIALTITKVLSYAEEQGIVHGDITAGNIRIDRFGHIRLLDFGLSRAVGNPETRSRFKLGTPETMSPEQIRGDKIDIRSDLYSLGIVLFQSLVGHPPFRGTTNEEIEDQHLHRKLELPSECHTLPPRLQNLICRLLAKAKEDRPSCAGVVQDALIAMGAKDGPLGVYVSLEALGQNPGRRSRLSSPFSH